MTINPDPDFAIMPFKHINENSGFSLAGGVFTTSAGPGLYEVVFGAAWTSSPNPYIPLQLYVNGAPRACSWFPYNSSSGFPVRAIIVPITTTPVTFSVRVLSATDTVQLASDSPGIGAYITIKKLS